jgi:putative FmdB family regulatory protein
MQAQRPTTTHPSPIDAREHPVPLYDFRCRTCGDTFEVRRSMADAATPATCPAGHADTVKLMPLVAVGGRAEAGAGPAAAPRAGGGCCGGACGCG